MKVRFDRAALADIHEITDYIAARSPKAAASLLDRISDAVALLKTAPQIGAKTSREEFRRLVIQNYLLVYELSATEIVIRYIRHGARRRPWEDD